MLTRNFKDLDKNDSLIAGGKGASLGEMIQVGIPVPDGFVILTEAFEKFLEETDIKQEIDAELDKVDKDKIHTVEHASERIQKMIIEAQMTADIEKEIENEFEKLKKCHSELDSESNKDNDFFVAVRSSATAEDSASAAWAGQLDSFLNTTEKDLLENIKKCWASLFAPRAIFYRFEKGLEKSHVSVAVVVQKMIDSEKSGIAFSVHPVTEDYNQIIIEAGYGLGEAIVSGSITPDSYVVDKSRIKNYELRIEDAIIDININTQTRGLYRKKNGGNEWRDIPEPQASFQVLDNEEILELSELIIKIENHYGFPCDIEWAHEKGKFYITQSRPITTLGPGLKIKPPLNTELINYAKSQMWGCFKNSKRKLLHASLWARGIREKMHLIDGDVVANEDIDVNIDLDRVLRVFNLNQPQLENNILERYLDDPSEILKFIDENYRLLKKAQDITLKIEKSIREGDKKSIKKNTLEFIDIQLEMSAYEYFINGLAQGLYNKFKQEEIINVLNKINNWRNDESIDSVSEILRRVLQHILKDREINITPKKAISFLHIDEFVKILEDKILNEEIVAIIDNRSKEGYVLLNFRDKKYQNKVLDSKNKLEMEEIEKLINSVYLFTEKQKLNDKNEIKGQGVFKTEIFQGECVVLSQEKDLSAKLDLHNKILVTTMTTPKFVPYLKGVKGIITDNGGLICHAAIIARELKIPCIIGTEVATQVLHDGDLVEVDANEGVVRILEKNK